MAVMTVIQQQYWLIRVSVWDKSQEVMLDIVCKNLCAGIPSTSHANCSITPRCRTFEKLGNMRFPVKTKYGGIKATETLPQASTVTVLALFDATTCAFLFRAAIMFGGLTSTVLIPFASKLYIYFGLFFKLYLINIY